MKILHSIRKQPILSMSLINPPLTMKKSIRVELEQGGEGPIPHVHVLLQSPGTSRRTKQVAYVRLDSAEYSNHHKNGKRLNADQKAEFIDIMSSVWGNTFIISKNDNKSHRLATGYEAAVSIWIDTYGGSDKFEYDEDGYPVMPDYSTL